MPWLKWALLIIFFVAILIFGLIERKSLEPIIPIKLFKKRNTLIASIVTIVGYFAMAGTYFFSSFASTAFGLSYSMAAYTILPMTIASLITTMLVGKLLDKVGAKPIMIIGGVFTVLGMLILANALNLYVFEFSMIMIGVGNASIVGNALYYIFLEDTERKERASGQALLNILLNTGSLIGGAVLALVIDYNMGSNSFRDLYYYLAIIYLILTLLSIGITAKGVKSDDNGKDSIN